MNAYLGHFRQFLGNSDRPAWLVSLDGALTCLNPAMETALGIPSVCALGRSCRDFLDAADAARLSDAFERLKRKTENSVRIEGLTLGLRTVDCTISTIQDKGQPIAFLAQMHAGKAAHVPVRHAGGEAARAAHERLRSIADNAPAGIFVFRPTPDGSGEFAYTSAKFDDLVGRPKQREDEVRKATFALIHPDDRPEFLASVTASARSLTHWHHRFRVQHPDRGTRWVSGAATPKLDEDGSVSFTGVIYDVTKDVEREAALATAHKLAEKMRQENERLALYDGLTGLPNRRYYDKVVATRRHEARTGHGPKGCVLIRIDLDHFKYVNDTLGHEAGDKVLCRVGEVLHDSIRDGDFASRIGGDEFSVILGGGSTEDDAMAIVERIQASLAEPLLYDGRHCRFGASFGIAKTDNMLELGADLQLFADAALFRAKARGRNRMEFFTPELRQSILNDRRLAAEIQDGLENDEFLPYFQPQMCAHKERLVGVETLLRWRHPTRGLLAPDSFMHVAEQLRVVPEIDRIMMEKARRSLDRWRASGLVVPKISFNVSSGRMHEPDVVSGALAIANGATKVTFELLESILVEEESDAFRFHLEMIREAGIDIEIDDFGSGHASIIGLTEISPSALKIDQRLVFPVVQDVRARNLVCAIVEIAETLGINTIAEGVETKDHANILRALGCDVLQGYLFSEPLSENDLLRFATGLERRTA